MKTTDLEIAFVKQPWVVAWSRETTYFTTPRAMLNSFDYKTPMFSLMCAAKADVIVLPENSQTRRLHSWRMWRDSDPEALQELNDRTRTDSWYEVPWHKYDVIFSAGRIIPEPIIRAYPDILWVTLDPEHSAQDFDAPLATGYDLQWDYTTYPTVYMIDALRLRAINGLVPMGGKGAVWLPSRHVRPNMQGQGLNFSDRQQPLIYLADLPVYHPEIWNLSRTYRAILDGCVERPALLWRRLAHCRYMIDVGNETVGQPALEAAGIGVIVITTKDMPYSTLANDYCLVSSFEEAVEAVRLLEDAPRERRAILRKQDRVLETVFWDAPMETLTDALEAKQCK